MTLDVKGSATAKVIRFPAISEKATGQRQMILSLEIGDLLVAVFDSSSSSINTKPASDEGQASSSIQGPSDIELTSFLEAIYLHDNPNSLRQAVDLTIGYIDKLLNGNCFEACRELLARADTKRLSPTMIVSFLGITLAARDTLAESRTRFVKKAESRLVEELGTERAARLLGKYT